MLSYQGFETRFYDAPNRGTLGLPAVTAYWNHKTQKSYSPFSLFSVWGFGNYSPFVSSGIVIKLTFDEDARQLFEIEVQAPIDGSMKTVDYGEMII